MAKNEKPVTDSGAIDHTDGTLEAYGDRPANHIDLKLTSTDALTRRVIEDFYKKDFLAGVTEFPGQILRVEERREKFQPSTLDSFKKGITREITRRYKVKVAGIHDFKTPPITFDETDRDKKEIDSYPDFIYLPYSFGNVEPMNVGDFVIVTFANLKTYQGGRILYKLSGASHAHGSVGSPEKHVRRQQQPAKASFSKSPSQAPAVPVKTEDPKDNAAPKPPVIEPKPAEPEKPPNKDDRTFVIGEKTKLYRKLSTKKDGTLYTAEEYAKIERDYKQGFKNASPRYVYNINNFVDRSDVRFDKNRQIIKIDFKDPINKKYKRATKPNSSDDDIYIRALLDTIALRESGLNYGYGVVYQSIAHKEDLGDTLKEFSQHPKRPGSIVNSPGENYGASDAAGRYQFLYRVWKSIEEKLKLPDFRPESQDLAGEHLLYDRIKKSDLLKILKSDSDEEFKKLFKVNTDGKKPYSNLSNCWTSLPGGLEVTKLKYTGEKYKTGFYDSTTNVFRHTFNVILEDQKLFSSSNETKFNSYQSVINQAIERSLLEKGEQPAKKETPKATVKGDALKGKKVLIMGDSLTEVEDLNGTPNGVRNYGYFLKSSFESESADLDFFAVKGWSAFQFLQATGKVRFESYVAKSKVQKYDILIIGLGTNDAAALELDGGKPTTVQTNRIVKMFDSIDATQKFYISPPNINEQKIKNTIKLPNGDSYTYKEGFNSRINRLYSDVKSAIVSKNIKDFDSRTVVPNNPAGDGIHLGGQTAYKWASAVYKFVTGLDTKLEYPVKKQTAKPVQEQKPPEIPAERPDGRNAPKP